MVQIQQIQNKYVWGLYLNIGVSIFCILIILGLAYQKNRYSYPINTDTIVPKSITSISTTEYENVSEELPNQIDNIHAFTTVIRQQSKEQLRAWQQRNADSNFAPEQMVPMYFKDFYGDAASMER